MKAKSKGKDGENKKSSKPEDVKDDKNVSKPRGGEEFFNFAATIISGEQIK